MSVIKKIINCELQPQSQSVDNRPKICRVYLTQTSKTKRCHTDTCSQNKTKEYKIPPPGHVVVASGPQQRGLMLAVRRSVCGEV